MKAWHFVGKTLRGGRPVPADGETLYHQGGVIPFYSGLHASAHVFDALQYAPGATLCRVELAGTIVKAPEMVVASERTILQRIDATDLLNKFARLCALDVAHLWDCPDVVLRYLHDGDESLRDAAWSASWSGSRSACWSAARSACWSAARDAVAAARDAARAAARAAAREDARKKQHRRLSRMVRAEFNRL